jgi:hypothetical protein
MTIMTRALSEAELPSDVETYLREFFDATATFMMNRP